MERQAVVGLAGRTFKMKLSFEHYFFKRKTIRYRLPQRVTVAPDRGMQPTGVAERWNAQPPRSTPQPWQSGPASCAKAPCRRASPPAPAEPRGATHSRPSPPCCTRCRSAAGTSSGPVAPARTEFIVIFPILKSSNKVFCVYI